MPAVALSRAGARVVESGPDGENLAASTWQRLEALPDPRSPQGRIYPLACLIAIAVCAFTAAGNDRLTAVGQWTKRASQEDLARLRAPWDAVAGVSCPVAQTERSRLLQWPCLPTSPVRRVLFVGVPRIRDGWRVPPLTAPGTVTTVCQLNVTPGLAYGEIVVT